MYKLLVFVLVVLLSSCGGRLSNKESERIPGMTEAIEDSLELAAAYKDQEQIKVAVQAITETTPVPSVAGEDAADDPAFWYNAAHPEESRIIGTDKKGGLAIYNLNGEELHYYQVGRLNNVDLRYGFELNGQLVDVVAASDRSKHSVRLYTITEDGLTEVGQPLVALDSAIVDEPYGLCMYHNKADNSYYVFVGGKEGGVQQLKLVANADSILLEPVRHLQVGSQAEGMTADDETDVFYLAEEAGGIHKFSAHADGDTSSVVLPLSHGKDNPALVADLEGIDLSYGPNGTGYLIVSSQGNFSYALFERQESHSYIGSFKIVDGVVDGVEETDGLCVFGGAVGERFPQGLLVVQDGFNKDGDVDKAQNFKLVNWGDVLERLLME